MNIQRLISKSAAWHPANATVLLCICALMLFASGCESGRTSLAEQVSTLKREKKQLTRQLEQSKGENKQLKKQLQVLTDLPEDRLEALYQLQIVKITGYTNLYDKDEDGQDETLIVYIQPMDENGDIIKATGAVDVQLWDLNKPSGQALLAQWHVKPDQLKKLWLTSLMRSNYRLTFDVTGKIKKFEEPLTVKVTFTDYLTGKVFKEQKVIEPR